MTILLVSSSALAQEESKTDNLEKLAQQVEKANKSLQKKVTQLQHKLEKKLKKAYPELSTNQLDSLKDAQTGEVPVDLEAVLLQDSTLQKIKGWKTKLRQDLDLTPPNLDIAKDLKVSIKELDELQSLYEKVKIPELKVPDLKSKAKGLLSKSDLSDLTGKAEDLQKLVSDYKNNFKGWDEKLLAKATNIEEIKLIKEQQEKLAAYKPLPEGYRENMDGFQTNDFVKEQLEAKAEEIKKIGGETLQEKFDAAQEKLSEAKEKYGSLESLKDAPKRKPNPYKGDPFLKRIKWGGNFQINKDDPASVDIAVQASYLLNQRARFGTGVSYRVTVGKNFQQIDFKDQVFGTRTFLDYTIYKSIYLEALMEWTRARPKETAELPISHIWTRAFMLGAGNRFNITKKLKGTFTVLYNFSYNENSPHPSPWVFRAGFEL
ncbi:hypothetical protein [Roseivirga seohaensis]|uniref:hypothetical protein n=1 Tax=Roseivirga seohaensis TaxID=1914963 RepID=UPI003BAACDCC